MRMIVSIRLQKDLRESESSQLEIYEAMTELGKILSICRVNQGVLLENLDILKR